MENGGVPKSVNGSALKADGETLVGANPTTPTIPYVNAKIYGPYTRKDGRKHIIAIFKDGVRKTVSYPKYLVELHIGRYLIGQEEVHHKDEDYTNDNIDNLEIKNKSEHARLHSTKYEETIEVICVYCGIKFILNREQQQGRVQNKTYGPFCSKSCSGKYGTDIQYGRGIL